MLLGEFPTNLIVVEPHVSDSDPFKTAETQARGSWYGVSGIPDVRIDGKYAVVGAGNCSGAAGSYRIKINQRLAEEPISPVDITGNFTVLGTTGGYNVTVTQLDPGTFSNYNVTFYLYEDNVFWCCGYGGASNWMETVRVVRTHSNVTLSGVGQTATVSGTYNIPSNWVPTELHAVAVFQDPTSQNQKVIVQAARLQMLTDFTVTIPAKVASVPAGNDYAFFTGTLKNESTGADIFSLSVDNGWGWPAEFQLAGDPNWYTSTSIPLPAQQEVGVTIRVLTDGVKRIGTGNFVTVSTASGRSQASSLRVFNMSPSILFVDDDYNGLFEDPYIHGLDHNGYLYEDWDVYNGHGNSSPRASNMLGFDVVIWQQGYRTSDLLSAQNIGDLEAYLDAGGNLYLNSMDFLTTSEANGPFTTDYLGVATWSNNTKCHTATGVAGQFTEGLVLPLTFAGGDNFNRVDTVNPSATAAAIFTSEINTRNAVKNVRPNGAKVVFSTILQNAISESDPAPNNSDTVMQRIITWLTTEGPSSVPETAASGFVAARPNPFGTRTDIGFHLSTQAASRPVTITMIDPAGRAVRTLTSGSLTPGAHSLSWDGCDDAGRPVASGIYFARLKSLDGEARTKLVLMR